MAQHWAGGAPIRAGGAQVEAGPPEPPHFSHCNLRRSCKSTDSSTHKQCWSRMYRIWLSNPAGAGSGFGEKMVSELGSQNSTVLWSVLLLHWHPHIWQFRPENWPEPDLAGFPKMAGFAGAVAEIRYKPIPYHIYWWTFDKMSNAVTYCSTTHPAVN